MTDIYKEPGGSAKCVAHDGQQQTTRVRTSCVHEHRCAANICRERSRGRLASPLDFHFTKEISLLFPNVETLHGLTVLV